MFEGIKGAIRSMVDRNPEVSLSVVPTTKAAELTFDALGANLMERNGYRRMAAALGGGLPAWSGESVNTSSSLALSTVWACNRIISESVGFLPLNMLQGDGKTNKLAASHPMYGALRNAPNCEITAQSFSELLTSHCVLGGNSYAQIVRRSGVGTAVELNPITPGRVQADREREGQRRLVYVVSEQNQPDKTYTVERGKPQDILHIRGIGGDGIRGYSVIQMARQSFGTAIAQERNVAAFYANGGRVPYVLSHPNHFEDDKDFDAFRADWEQTYRDPHKAIILEDGLTYTKIGVSAADAQLLESRQFTIPEICRWFSVSPHLVGDLSRATFANIESLADQFVRFTLMTWLTRWEQELWRCVLTPDEQQSGFYFRHDLDALLRSDFQTRMAGYASLLQNGVASINEVRAKESLNPIKDGDAHFVQVNLAPVAAASSAVNTNRVAVSTDKK